MKKVDIIGLCEDDERRSGGVDESADWMRRDADTDAASSSAWRRRRACDDSDNNNSDDDFGEDVEVNKALLLSK